MILGAEGRAAVVVVGSALVAGGEEGAEDGDLDFFNLRGEPMGSEMLNGRTGLTDNGSSRSPWPVGKETHCSLRNRAGERRDHFGSSSRKTVRGVQVEERVEKGDSGCLKREVELLGSDRLPGRTR